MSKFDNRKQKDFLKNLNQQPNLEDDINDLTLRCKFNFSYFVSNQDAGQDFVDWEHKQLVDLLNKLKNYCAKSLDFWRNERVGKDGLRVLEIYGYFPSNSDFVRPKHIPHQAQWGRFRLNTKIRLVGFTIPTDLHRCPHRKTGEFFDKNTFYIVFLDRDHKFYLLEKK